jgi:pimeloyl-ACP methyl ester carboxylesterase
MRVMRVPDASHWIVHEQPALVAREIEAVLSS